MSDTKSTLQAEEMESQYDHDKSETLHRVKLYINIGWNSTSSSPKWVKPEQHILGWEIEQGTERAGNTLPYWWGAPALISTRGDKVQQKDFISWQFVLFTVCAHRLFSNCFQRIHRGVGSTAGVAEIKNQSRSHEPGMWRGLSSGMWLVVTFEMTNLHTPHYPFALPCDHKCRAHDTPLTISPQTKLGNG